MNRKLSSLENDELLNQVTSHTDTEVVCTCNHLTNFGLMLDWSGQADSQDPGKLRELFLMYLLDYLNSAVFLYVIVHFHFFHLFI